MNSLYQNPLNWEQSPRPASSADVLMSLLAAQRAESQKKFANSPFGSSFNRRFGGLGLPEPAAPSGPSPDDLATLDALQQSFNQAVQADGNSSMFNVNGEQRLKQGTGSLQSQPWYDELVALGQAGGGMPTIQGNARPLTEAEKAGIKSRRDARLAAGQAGTLPMEERRALVRNRAQAKSDQRQVRMGDMDPFAAQIAALQRLGLDENMMNTLVMGPEAAVGFDRNNMQRQLGREAIQAEFPQQPGLDPQMAVYAGIYERSGGSWDKFKNMANAAGLTAEETLRAWALMTGEQRGGPAKPSILESLPGMGSGWDWNPYD